MRRFPGALARALIDKKPAAIRSVPFSYPARRKAVIGVGRRGTLMRSVIALALGLALVRRTGRPLLMGEYLGSLIEEIHVDVDVVDDEGRKKKE